MWQIDPKSGQRHAKAIVPLYCLKRNKRGPLFEYFFSLQMECQSITGQYITAVSLSLPLPICTPGMKK